MAPTSTGPDAADLGLLAALKAHARVEVEELTSRLGLSGRRIRARMRRLEREGLIRGYHAVAAAPETDTSAVLAMLRFVDGLRPTADDIRQLCGVRRVYALCSTWDFMIEFSDGGQGVLGNAAPDIGMVELLGSRAQFELLTVQREHLCAARSHSHSERKTIVPFLALTHLLLVAAAVSLVRARTVVAPATFPRCVPPTVRDVRDTRQPAALSAGLTHHAGAI